MQNKSHPKHVLNITSNVKIRKLDNDFEIKAIKSLHASIHAYLPFCALAHEQSYHCHNQAYIHIYKCEPQNPISPTSFLNSNSTLKDFINP